MFEHFDPQKRFGHRVRLVIYEVLFIQTLDNTVFNDMLGASTVHDFVIYEVFANTCLGTLRFTTFL